jgi:hypothetical protein
VFRSALFAPQNRLGSTCTARILLACRARSR